jgi:hypothetical protein
MKPVAQLVLTLIAFACVFSAGYFFRRARRRDIRRLVVFYGKGEGQIIVNACGCPSCKNVVWAQRVDIEPPKFCAYCGQKFVGNDIADDTEMSEFIIPDEP